MSNTEQQHLDIKIAGLELRDFRQFELLEMAFEPQLTVLLAENGGGKTTILDGIAGALMFVANKLSNRVRDIQPFTKSDVRLQSNQASFTNTLIFKGSTEDVETYFEQTTNRTNYSSDTARLSDWHNDVLSGAANLPILAYYPCSLSDYIKNTSTNGSLATSIFDVYEHAFDDNVLNFKELKKWIVWKYQQEIESKDTAFDMIRQALVGKDGFLNDADNQAFTNIKVSYTENPEGNLLFIKKDAHLNEKMLSSGEKMLVMLVADIVRRMVIANPLSKKPLREGTGIVLIDEIDLHLHPKWQRKVAPMLCRPRPSHLQPGQALRQP